MALWRRRHTAEVLPVNRQNEIDALTAVLFQEAKTRSKHIAENATWERCATAARITYDRKETQGFAGTDDQIIDELTNIAVGEEPHRGIGLAIGMWLLQAVLSWLIRRAIQHWRIGGSL